MIDSMLLFGVAFLVTLIQGYVVRWVASFLTEERSSYVAGFSFTLGVSFASIGQIDTTYWDMTAGAICGVIAGLAWIWHRFFKREMDNG